jgi:hypothetical protein
VDSDCSEYAQTYFVSRRKEEADVLKAYESQGVDPKVLEHFNANRTD